MAASTIERQQQLGEIGREPQVRQAVAKGRTEMLNEVSKAVDAYERTR